MWKPISRFRERSAKVTAGAAALIVTAASARAGAQDFITDSAGFKGAHITVARAPGASACPDAARVRAELDPLDIVRMSEEPLEIRIEIRIHGDGFGAFIVVSGRQSGVRELQAPGADCRKLADDLNASLVLLLDQRSAPSEPVSVEEPEKPPPPERPEQPAGAEKQATQPRAARRAPRNRDRPLFLRADAELSGAAWLVGTLAPAFGASFWVEGDEESAALTAFTTLDEASSSGPGRVNVRLSGGYLRGCTRVVGTRSGWHGRLCAVGALAALRGHAKDYARRTDAAYRPWYALGAGITAGGPVSGRFGWTGAVTGLAPLHRESFSVAPLGAVFQTPYAGFFAGAGASLSIE